MFTSSISRRSTGSSVPCSELPCRLCPCRFQAFRLLFREHRGLSLIWFSFSSVFSRFLVFLAFFFLSLSSTIIIYKIICGAFFWFPFLLRTLVYNVSPGAAMLSPCCPSHITGKLCPKPSGQTLMPDKAVRLTIGDTHNGYKAFEDVCGTA